MCKRRGARLPGITLTLTRFPRCSEWILSKPTLARILLKAVRVVNVSLPALRVNSSLFGLARPRQRFEEGNAGDERGSASANGEQSQTFKASGGFPELDGRAIYLNRQRTWQRTCLVENGCVYPCHQLITCIPFFEDDSYTYFLNPWPNRFSIVVTVPAENPLIATSTVFASGYRCLLFYRPKFSDLDAKLLAYPLWKCLLRGLIVWPTESLT